MKIKDQREAIIKFMKWKSRCIANEIGIKGYWTKDETNYIMELKGKEIKKITESIKGYPTAIFKGDESMCPHCILYKFECSTCPYGIKHGECPTETSLYGRIASSNGGISDVIGQEKIINKIKEIMHD